MKDITELIVENEGLIYKIINKYRNYFELEDLYQVAVMGIIKASKNYNSEYGAKFTSYAYPFILGEVIKYINEYKSIKINKESRKLYSKILQATEILSQKLMKIPTSYDLSLFLEIDESIIEEILSINTTVDSLDRIISQDGKDLELYDKLGYYDSRIDNYPLIAELEKLSPIERKIIESRYFDNLSQSEIGANLGMYQVEVSRREKKILRKLKDNIAAQLIKEEEIYNLIAKNIKQQRKLQGITQKELAQKTGYSYAYIRRIEAPSCSKNFSILTIYNICNALNISISSLFNDDNI